MSKLPPIDSCIVRVKQKLVTDPSSKSVRFPDWIKDASVDGTIKDNSRRAFGVMASYGLIVPYIDYEGSGLLMTWNNDSETQRRIVYISLQPGRSIRYQVALHPVVNGDYEWKFITDSDTAIYTFQRIAQYAIGSTAKASA